VKARLAFLLPILSLSLFASGPDRKKLEIETTQSMSFTQDGEILIQGSFGELELEGWDRSEVEITIRKGTRKKYPLEEQEKALRFLNSVEVIATGQSANHLVISTSFPDRSLFTRPLRGKSNIDLSYKIKAPRTVKVAIEHDTGEVNIRNISGDIKVTARIGQISLRVPRDENYTINASVRLGEVESDFRGHSGRKFLSERFVSDESRGMRNIYARVGIGQINIRKMQASAPAQRRPELMALIGAP
jgi:hypothetical protein